MSENQITFAELAFLLLMLVYPVLLVSIVLQAAFLRWRYGLSWRRIPVAAVLTAALMLLAALPVWLLFPDAVDPERLLRGWPGISWPAVLAALMVAPLVTMMFAYRGRRP